MKDESTRAQAVVMLSLLLSHTARSAQGVRAGDKASRGAELKLAQNYKTFSFGHGDVVQRGGTAVVVPGITGNFQY